LQRAQPAFGERGEIMMDGPLPLRHGRPQFSLHDIEARKDFVDFG
jgi:hypothetical protein